MALVHNNYMPKTSIVIPLKNSVDEIIEISFDNLPEGEEVLQILKGERAALHYWLDLALDGGDAGLDYEHYEKDQMRALDMLAAYYVIQGNKERNKEKKKEFTTKATLLYTTADKIIMYDQSHLLGRAYFCLLEGNKIEQADAQYNYVIQAANVNDTSKSIPALMGKACIAFSKKEYKTALFFYKKCLRLNHNCPADIRVGMGYCLSRMGKHDKARLAFERALEIEPANIAAVVALAVLDINTLEHEGIKNGIQGMSLAYQNEPENPMVLNHLANHFFYRNDLEKTEQLAWHAFQLTENEQMRAESCYQLARCFHMRATQQMEKGKEPSTNFDKAFRYYYQATQFNHPKFILPYFGLGQIYIHREEYDNAIAAFEKILKVVPTNYETLSVLGSLYTYMDQNKPGASAVPLSNGGGSAAGVPTDRSEKAREVLKKVVEMCPDDIEVLIELAHLQEQPDPQASLKLYLRVADLLQNKEGIEIPAEILNNIGSLHFVLGRLEEAKSHFEAARNFVLSEGVENLNDDRELYREIIKQRPTYLDCILRLGCLVRDKGDSHNASLLFKESMSINPSNLQEQKDTYSFVALGNIWLDTLFTSRTKEKDGLYRDRALAMFVKALKLRPKNIWAANGIGCLLAHKGEILEARDIFSQVREATADFPDVWINVAHIYMEQRQYVSALQMYKNCMTKFNKFHDVQLMQYIARAYWKAANYSECRAYVEKAMTEAPDNLLIKFNHAVILQKMATNCLKDEKSNLEVVTGAVEDLKIAERTFTYISSTAPEVIIRFRYISRTVCTNEAQVCSDLLKQARTYLQRAQAKDEEERRQREKQEEERLALLNQRQAEERLKEEKKMKELEELKQLRQHYVEKTKEILKLKEVKEEKKSRSGGKTSSGKKKREDRDEFVNDSSDLGEYADGDTSKDQKRSKDKSSRKRRERQQQGSSDDENEAESSQNKRKQKKKKVSERQEREEVSAKMRGKIKSKAFLSSSESSPDSSAEKETKKQNVDSDDSNANAGGASSRSSGDEADQQPSSSKAKATSKPTLSSSEQSEQEENQSEAASSPEPTKKKEEPSLRPDYPLRLNKNKKLQWILIKRARANEEEEDEGRVPSKENSPSAKSSDEEQGGEEVEADAAASSDESEAQKAHESGSEESDSS
uniref:RNA polymerase-associated protein CTR9 homolog n=1 Tax=Ditylenchus dipsaci TaxID=166011 RepID=A0A915CPW2_9BILA